MLGVKCFRMVFMLAGGEGSRASTAARRSVKLDSNVTIGEYESIQTIESTNIQSPRESPPEMSEIPSQSSPESDGATPPPVRKTESETKRGTYNLYESVHSVIAFKMTQPSDRTKPVVVRKSDIPFFSGAEYWRRLQRAREATEQTWHQSRPTLFDPAEYIILDADDKPPRKKLSPKHFKSLDQYIKYQKKMHAVEKHEEKHGRSVSIAGNMQKPRPVSSIYYNETVYGKYTGKKDSEPIPPRVPSPVGCVDEDEDEPDLIKTLRERKLAKQRKPLDPRALNRYASTETFKKRRRLKQLMATIPEPTPSRMMLSTRLDMFMYEKYLPRLESVNAKKIKKLRKMKPKPYKPRKELNLDPILPEDVFEKPLPNLFETGVSEDKWKEWILRRVRELVVRKEQVTYGDGIWPTVTSITFTLPPPTL